MTMDELKYVNGKFTVNGIDINSISATSAITEAVEIAQTISANTKQFSVFDDPEGRTEITTDADNKILGYRDSEGVRHENSLSIEHLEASDEIFNMFSKRLNLEKSFSKFGDLSDYDNIKMIIPDCAFVNIFTVGGNTNFPETKHSNLKCYMQFTDNRGIYFKKKIIANAQGNSSLGDPKKNLAIDICNDDWIGDDTCTITFGNWVPQDSFHLKAYYSDTFVGIPAIGYKLFNEIVKTRGVQHDRNWKRALKLDAGIVPSVLANEDISKRLDSGARCFPDAFPCVLFIEGRFYGIYSWQLKKHRDNYAMGKKNALNIHLDGAISSTSFFCANGNIDWDIWNAKKEDANHLKDGIEIRNPKSLIGIDGSKYDFDTNAVELIDENSELYDERNKDMVRSAKVKSILIDATKHIPNVLELVNTNETTENIRAKIEEYFDVESIIDYIIFSDLTQNIDGLLKNWQWTTYDGIVWSVSPYDLDWTFGLKGTQEGIPSSSHLSSTTDTPYGLVCQFYKEELTARYTQLRNQGIINTNHITDMLNNWVKSVGMKYYVLEQETWKDKRKDNIYRFANWVSKSIECFDIFYKYNK